MANNEVWIPDNYFREQEKKVLKEFELERKEKLNIINLHPKTKDKYFNTLIEYKRYTLAAAAISDKHNALNADVVRLTKLYRQAQNNAVAQEYLKQLNNVRKIQAELKKAYEFFIKKNKQMETEVLNIQMHIDEKLEELGFDQGLDERPKLPSVKPTRK
jgi:excinuclease UvrABC helicase subunit UvrB